MLMTEDNEETKTEDSEDTKTEDTGGELGNKYYPPVEVAEARIKQALLRHKVKVGRVTPASEKEKVRL